MLIKPNNLIAVAIPSGVNSATKGSVTKSERIDGLLDVDLYQFQLNKGQGITLEVTTESGSNNKPKFDSFLRIFDADGNELAFNDDSHTSSGFSLDSHAGFIANNTGEYYVGISSTRNRGYDSLKGRGISLFSDRFTGANYDLTFSLVDVLPDEDLDNTIAEAKEIKLDPQTNSAVISGAVETKSDVDLYRLELPESSGINLDLKAVGDDSNLDSYLRLFDAEGKELAFNDDDANKTGTVDSAISFATEAEGEYFIGVSNARNSNYDQINGDTNLNFMQNTGTTRGDYQLELKTEAIVADRDPDNTIAEAIAFPIASLDLNSNVFDGEINSEVDVDVYQFTVGMGEGVSLDISTKGLDSELNSYLRLFDAQGNELAVDDDNDVNPKGNLDAKLSYIPDTPGSYYAAVSTSGNSDYDPVAGRTNFDPDVSDPNRTMGNYQLEIAVAEVEADSDPDNVLAEAIKSGVSSRRTQSASLTGRIAPGDDVDIYQVQLDLGDGITANLDTSNLNSGLDSYLRLFDSQGTELAFDNDSEGNLPNGSDLDSLLTFAPQASGTYFVGVSSDGNTEYDAVEGKNNFTPKLGFSRGNYVLNLDIAAVSADVDADNTFAEAIAFDPDFSTNPSTIASSIESPSDVDLYVVDLNIGNTISVDLNTTSETTLDTFVRIFDAEGNELEVNDDGIAPGETSSLDAYTEFTALTRGTYYVGVSSFGNSDYDPVNGSNNFSQSAGSTTGNYALTIDSIDLVNPIEGTAAAERLNGSAQADLISGLAGNDTILGAAQADNIIGGAGNDILYGNQGNDILQGGAGDDTLSGGNGEDILDGAVGADRLIGDAGADAFVIGPDIGVSNIVDFETGVDKIALIEGISFADLSFNSVDIGTRIKFDNRIIGTIIDLEPSQILESDFIAEM